MGNSIRLRINVPLLGHAAGSEIDIPSKADGSPAELFWRRRLRDARADGCVTVVPPSGKSEPAAARELSARGGE